MKKLCLLFGMAPLITGCLQLPLPALSLPESYACGQVANADSLPYDLRWWRHFADPLLDSLQERALAQNRDLAVAASRVETAQHALQVARTAYLPEFSLGFSAEGSRTESQDIEQAYKIAPAMQWELSLFGALRASTRAARAELLATEWAFRGVVLSLTAEVANAYFQLLAYENNWYFADESCRLRGESAALIDSMTAHGMASRVARDQAYSLLYSAEVDRASYRQQADQAWIALQVLLGDMPTPSRSASWRDRLYLDTMPATVPVGLPADLLNRRPDVMEARYGLEEEAARVGVARAARYPALSLTADGGLLADEWKGLTSGDPWIWNAVASLTQPLFAFGKLKRQEEIARENYLESLFDYEQAVVQAVGDVEQALVAVARSGEALRRSGALVEVNRSVAQKSRALYENGMSAYLDVIDAERTYYESQMQHQQELMARYAAYISLYKALGGGW